ncbi:hypothetical protein ETN89_20385 (plasmid) [Photobacterium damselae subsp. damselae]|uniref:hypothetical protein n=1 Tax=Photobacterium damselae TaxID=38293 RepID=UPI000A2FD3FC|nr:hypothetical protein [Photobacterium damselae]ARR51829.1 hypothetical protein CAY62_20680 [Photobacterium damselae subsp. damselae]QAY37596.1 hypothetical protein ETN89_20385 [Photobacterium damselae subsp. damselae]
MIIIDNAQVKKQLNIEQQKLEQSLAVYRTAIINNYTHELPFLLKRVERNQRDFQEKYKRLNPLTTNIPK